MSEKLNKYLQIETRSFVVLGEFLPSIYHPSWLRSRGVISEQDENNAQVDEITKDACAFHVGGWLDFVAMRDRMQFLTRQQAYFPTLNDLAYNLFMAIPNVIVKAVGINFIYSLKMPDRKTYYEVGATMVGLEKWNSVLPSPKLLDITLRCEEEEKDSFLTHVKISPTSSKFRIDYGVDVAINHHMDMNKSDGKKLALFVQDKLEYCNNRSVEIIENILQSFV